MEVVSGDVTKADTLPRALEDIDVVIHLVGIIVEQGESTFQEVHYHGTVNLVESVRRAGIRRFLHMSALGSRPDAIARYHKTKFQAEEFLRRSGLEFTIFRPSIILGPNSEFLSIFATLTRLLPLLVIPQVRKGRLQPIWIGDVVDCFLQAIEKEETLGKTYELGGPEKLSLRQIVERISSSIGRKRPVLEVPMGLVRLGARLSEALLPKPPMTTEQLLMLKEDNSCDMQEVLKVFKIEHASIDEAIDRSLKSSG